MSDARIFLLQSSAASIFLKGTKEANDDFIRATKLIFSTAELNLEPAAGIEIRIPLSSLKKISEPDEDYQFKQDNIPFNLEVKLELISDKFLGWIASTDVDVESTMIIQIPILGQTSDKPFVKIAVYGKLAFEVGPFLNLEDKLCFQFTLDELPEVFPSTKLPSLDISLPDFDFKFPTIKLPNWHFPNFPESPFEFPALGIESTNGELPISASWEKFRLQYSSGILRLEFIHLRITSRLVPDITIECDLGLVFNNGNFDANASYIKLYQPDVNHLVPLRPEKLHVDSNCFALQWNDSHINYWLRQLAANFFDESARIDVETTLRIVFDHPVEEVRLDWKVLGNPRTFTIPGFKITTPDNVRLSILLRRADENSDQLTSLSFILTLDENTSLIASSNFAWERQDDRELQNDYKDDNDNQETTKPPLFQLTATAKNEVSLVLMSFRLDQLKLPDFFRQLDKPISELDFSNAAILCEPVPFVPISLRGNDWTVKLDMNTEFDFPFLKKKDDSPLKQFINLKKGADGFEVDFAKKAVKCPIDVVVHIGNLSFATQIVIMFNWEKFAFSVDHNKGIELVAKKSEFESQEHLGLVWRLKGSEITDAENINKGKFHYFTLVTQNYNYQIIQAPGSALEVDYVKASREPITFIVSDFVLSAKGINITAEVSDRPARLNGVDTRFRFHGTRLQIVENQIKDFTLSGSGPMPPALVGDAMVDISLQFSQRNGNLTLVAGGARLRGSKLLHCKGTRFQFSIDAIGLKFVNDGRFHLYFTLTGSAQFVLAPNDDKEGALALLPKIKIDLVECPLTGDTSVISKHVKFLIDLPKKISFSFLGCFEMELRAIGFVPQADVFDGDSAMLLTGQLKFAQGTGDTPNAKVDFHGLYIGLPRKGSFIPRIHLKHLAVNINFGAAVKLSGTVDFFDSLQEKGFSGEGMLQIQGLPTLAASFAFLRVRRDESSPWLRAWFIYLEVRQISFMIPVIQLYLREVGLGFGYRYTLVSIKTADRTNDIRKLIQELKKLSRTQGDLSKRDRWEVDLEERGEDPRWTIVLRAMISQTSASPSPLKWDPQLEKELVCTYLLDAVIAFRSDLTFFMAVRAWINTNYWDYVTNNQNLRESPLLSGFVLLSPQQKRLLAHLASNPNGKIGPHPPVPDYVNRAIANSQFSVTLLIEPGLFHYEMGWPNMLRWKDSLGPLQAEFRGGFIFRISKRELVMGTSFIARGSLRIEAKFDFGIIGLRLLATADVAYGARYIGVISFVDVKGGSALYGAIGLELRIVFTIHFWIRIYLIFTKITLNFKFSFTVGFTAGLEIGLNGLPLPSAGLRGSGTVSLAVMGHKLHLNVKLGVNESEVQAALNKTQKFLQVGLEATEVESLPGIGSGEMGMISLTAAKRQAKSTLAQGRIERKAKSRRGDIEASSVTEHFEAPNYNIFIIQNNEWTYYVLLPQGERRSDNGTTTITRELGFLPAPPNEEIMVDNDFKLKIKKFPFQTIEREDIEFEQYDPIADDWISHAEKLIMNEPTEEPWAEITWKVQWDAKILKAGKVEVNEEDGTPMQDPETIPEDEDFTLSEYLRHAFITELDSPIPIRDPELIETEEKVIQDERVYNPSDNSFEAAVRGAVEQFRGSPYFKRDPNYEYDRVLEGAFNDNTTIYSPTGQLPDEKNVTNEELQQIQMNEQAQQLRGMVIHDFIADSREYAESEDPELAKKSIAFQMGLVFRTQKQAPEGFDEKLDSIPKIYQRIGPDSTSPSATKREVRIFNVQKTNFSINAPQFQKVRQYTDANTIAITWDLVWEKAPQGIYLKSQAEPEHHLMHYQVRRRALDGSEREVVYTVKNAEALHLENSETGEPILKRLKPRFQIVDHFNQETLNDQAALPATGRSYLYTVTPFDFAGNAGRPLTLVATRYPNVPPQVPVDGELIVRYRIDKEILSPDSATDPVTPRVIIPNRIHVEWSEPVAVKEGPSVPIAKYLLIFRKDLTLPIGSYGLDSTTQGPRTKSLPTSNARTLPTDIKVEISPKGPAEARFADIAMETLQAAGIFPAGESPEWQPDSWRVFFQTVSVNYVPSALAPIQLLLRIEAKPAFEPEPNVLLAEREERRPAQIEWLPYPIRYALLPPEDQRAIPGVAHFPMPEIQEINGIRHAPKFTSDLKNVTFQPHPAGIRCIRFRWNQGPSHIPDYPLNLNAGFYILELDIDAHTTETFRDKAKLAKALRQIQEVQMLPAEDILLIPGDTLTTNQWEAWYPSTMLQRKSTDERPEGSEISLGPWYSWRESLLEWPEWPGLTDGAGERSQPLHPFLQKIIDVLNEDPDSKGLMTYNIDLQISPPIQPGNLAGFMNSTTQKSDPYGWGVLQRFGLSVAFSLRNEKTGEIIIGDELLKAVENVLNTYENLIFLENRSDRFGDYFKFLHVELLFQPGQSVSLEKASINSDSLLAIVQISLRPAIKQYFKYGKFTISGPSGQDIDLIFNIPADSPCTVINQADPAGGAVELEPNGEITAIKRTIKLPLNGQTTILLRCQNQLPEIGIELKATPDLSKLPDGFFQYEDAPIQHLIVKKSIRDLTEEQLDQFRDQFREALTDSDKAIADLTIDFPVTFSATDEFSTYFTVPGTMAANFSNASNDNGGKQWQMFKCYAESINSNGPDIQPDSKITIPTNQANIEPILPEFLLWSQRFFDSTGEVAITQALGETMNGPWLATAYPRLGSPAYTAPDKSGRLKYDHLLEDKWAHNYRYYIRPFGRYDLLWQSLRQSRALFPDVEEYFQKLPEATPEPQAGGLDVVLERTQPVDIPLVLSSTRLDESSTPAKPAVPGSTWEVIVAQHPEQALIERNQTLFRQLSFRHIAFTLLRRFAYPDWITMLEQSIEIYQKKKYTIQLQLVENQYPAIPTTYPPKPDHLDFDNLSNEEILGLNIPQRIGSFQQGAMVLQWDAIPYFYEHRLLLIAQTASNVSPINEITQRDFEYLSPIPLAIIEGIEGIIRKEKKLFPPVIEKIIDLKSTESIRLRQVEIPLKRFWDCLPQSARTQWSFEKPDDVSITDPKRRLSSLPDPDVVYQIIEIFNGNIEVQAEFLFDENALSTEDETVIIPNYVRRQLGQRFLAEILDLVPPTPEIPQADFILRATLLQITEVELNNTYNIPEDIIHIISKDNFLSIAGVFTWNDLDMLMKRLGSVDGYISRYVSGAPPLDEFTAELQAKVKYPELPVGLVVPNILQKYLDIDTIGISWLGPITNQQSEALQAYHKELTVFNIAVENLLAAMKPEAIRFSAVYDVPPRPRPDSEILPDKLKIEIIYPPDPNAAWILTWAGAITTQEEKDLKALNGDKPFKDEILILITDIKNITFTTGEIETGPTKVSTIPNFIIQIIPKTETEPEKRILTWRNPNPDQEAAIRALATQTDPPFLAGVDFLVQELNSYYKDRSFTRRVITDPFVYPRIDISLLQQQIKYNLTDLKLDSDKREISWSGADNVVQSIDHLIDRVRACLHKGDPFITAFETLFNQIAEKKFSAAFAMPRQLSCKGPLTNPELNELLDKFPADETLLNSLYEDLQDQQTLEGIYHDWFSQEQIAASLPGSDMPQDFEKIDPSECKLVWKGSMTETEKEALRSLKGDDAFKRAIGKLIKAAANVNTEDEFIMESAPLDPDLEYVPQILNENNQKIQLEEDVTGENYTKLTWNGLLYDKEETALRRWAQLPTFIEAVDTLIKILDEKEISETLCPEIPAVLQGKFQIGNEEIAWCGTAPTSDEKTAFQNIIDDETRDQIFRDAVKNLLQKAGEECVVTETVAELKRRPRQKDIPAILTAQLTIQDDQITWNGSIHSEEQLQALKVLSGDKPFNDALLQIIETLETAAQQVEFSLPIRPNVQDLTDESLKEKLLIGKTLIRYHGLMTVEEGLDFIDKFKLLQPDKDAIQRLYDSSMKKGMRGSVLKIRARRGSAAPSDMISLESKKLQK